VQNGNRVPSFTYSICVQIAIRTLSFLRLHFITNDGIYHRFDLTWCIDHSVGVDENDFSFVANVDGSVVGLTPFRQTVIPPPLSAFELRFEHKISQVGFSNSSVFCYPIKLAISFTRLVAIHNFHKYHNSPSRLTQVNHIVLKVLVVICVSKSES